MTEPGDVSTRYIDSEPPPSACKLGQAIETSELVTLEQEQRLKGLYVIGKTGSGKTTLLVNMILQDIKQEMGVCFFDTHGDAITDILKRLPPEREADVILLDLLDNDAAFGLNLFQCQDPNDKQEVSRVTSFILQVFAKLFTESGNLIKEATYMTEILQNTIPVFLAQQNPRITMAEIPLFLMNAVARTRLLAPLRNPIIQSYWESFRTWRPDRQEEVTAPTRRRVNNFLSDPLIFQIIGQSATTLDFRKIMDERKILLVKLSRQHELITSLVGSVIVAQLANAAFSRSDTPEGQRVQFNLYADEYQRFSTPTFAELLAEVRKFKIATCVAHQWRGQLDYANRGATLNAANTVVFQVSGEDAHELSQQFDATPIRTKQIPKMRLEPIYKEWDEYVWTEEWAQAAYEQLPHQIYEAERKSRQIKDALSYLAAAIHNALAANDPYHLDKFEDWKRDTTIFDQLLNHEPPDAQETGTRKQTWDELFVPPEEYFRYAGMRRNKAAGLATRSGLVKLGKPITYGLKDIYTEEEIWQYQQHRSFHKEHFLFFSRLVEKEKVTSDIPWSLQQGATVTVYEEGYILRPEAVEKVRLVRTLWTSYCASNNAALKELWEELQLVLLPFYAQKIWWFVSDPRCVEMNRAIEYSSGDPKAYDRIKRKAWIDQADPPPLGSEREDKNQLGPWSLWGKWDTTPTFPEAIAWLTEKVRSLMAQASEEEKHWSAEAKKLTAQRDRLAEQYHIQVHHKDYQGLQPVKEQQVTDLGYRSTRYGREPMTRTTEVQWYDLTEELDQTPATRRDEIANELANPKQAYTAWCKIGIEEHIISIEPFAPPDADSVWMARRNRIIERTRQHYCKKRATVDDEIMARQNALTKPLARPKAQTTSDEEEE